MPVPTERADSLAVSDQVSSAVEFARNHPVPVAGAGVAVLGIVAITKIRGSKSEEPIGAEPAPDAVVKAYANPGSTATATTVTPGKPNTSPGDGQGNPAQQPPTTTPFPLPGQIVDVTKPGEIASQAMRITAADRAAYGCDGNKYLRYGRTDKTRNKIVCVDRTKHSEHSVIVLDKKK